MIRIGQPLSFSEIGRKDNQEDYLYPHNATPETRHFILCDGMGGHDNGEVASMTAATALGRFLDTCTEVDIPTFRAGLAKAYDALDDIDTRSDRKPGTTLTCLCLNRESYLVAHIGDSRIYHIRPSLFNRSTGRGGILYQSSDHSLVNDLLKAGELTEEEARVFPHKNIITKAMQPHLENRPGGDVFIFDDVRGGDYFFMCSDGVLEQLNNERLCEILADRRLDDNQKFELIREACHDKTRDNYSCWLIPVTAADIANTNPNADVIRATDEGAREPTQPEAVQPMAEETLEETVSEAPHIPKRRPLFFIGILALTLALLALLWFFFSRLL